MRRKQRSRLGSLFDRAVLSALIFALIYILTHLVIHFPQQPTQLPSSSQPAQFYSNQTHDDLTQLYRQAIHSAKESIILAIYGLSDEALIEALNRKYQEGIAIHIVCDAEASKAIHKLHLPKESIVRRSGKGLMHQKILVIDSHSVYLGSANFTYSSLKLHGNLVIALDHPQLAKVLENRTKSMDDEGAFVPLLHQETRVGEQTLELWVLPDSRNADKRLIQWIRTAKKSIKVAMFTFTHNALTQELIAASKRGIKVEAVVDRNSGTGKGAKVVRMLEKEGIPITLNTSKGLLHHKFACIDETVLVHGSANWTLRAFSENDDYFVILHPLTSEQQQKMNDLWRTIQKQSQKPITTSRA